MTNDHIPKNGKPSTEDKQHIDDISKEINERLEEFGTIIFRCLGKETGSTFSKVTFERSEKGISVTATDNQMIGYYCDPPGVCQEQPC